jgi:uncharacterized protein
MTQNLNYNLNLDHQIPWVQQILREIQQNLTLEEQILHIPSSTFSFNGLLLKKPDPLYEEAIILSGEIQLTYHTPCIRCLVPTQKNLIAPVSVCFLSDQFEKSPEFEETATYFLGDSDKDLFFYKKKEIHLEPFFKEMVYLEMDDLPLHDEACLGLCQICGVNLNEETCSHS